MHEILTIGLLLAWSISATAFEGWMMPLSEATRSLPRHRDFRSAEHGLRRGRRGDTWGRVQMCICVNCKWVDTCKAYHFVETKHEQPHMTESPDFMPRDGSPTINVAVRTEKVRVGCGRVVWGSG